MRVVAIIQARLGGRRFPGKVLADLCGKPVLSHVINRVMGAMAIDETWVACPNQREADVISDACGYSKVLSGHCREDDVLGRVLGVAILTEADWIVRVCGECPLIDPPAIDHLVQIAKEGRCLDYVGYEFRGPHDCVPAIQRPTGYFAEVVHFEALKRADADLCTTDPRREHVTQAIYESPEYVHSWSEVPDWYTIEHPPDTAIDTPEDLERVAKIMRGSRGLL